MADKKKKNNKNDSITQELNNTFEELADMSIKNESFINSIISNEHFNGISNILEQESKILKSLNNFVINENILKYVESLQFINNMYEVNQKFFLEQYMLKTKSLNLVSETFEKIARYPLDSFSSVILEIKRNTFNDNYLNVIKNCFKEIVNSKININNLITIGNIFNEPIESVEDINEEEVNEAFSNVKEIIKNIDKDDKNVEQKIHEKYDNIKQAHPIMIGIVSNLFWIIISIVFSMQINKSSNQYYINNYYINVQTINDDTNKDFIENARYVNAKQLNIKLKPNKEAKIIGGLEFRNSCESS